MRLAVVAVLAFVAGCNAFLGDLDVSLSADAGADGGTTCAPAATCSGRCGKLTDTCGALQDCGGCPDGTTCGGGGANVCGASNCVPDCAAKACGASDGCAGVCMNGCGCSAATCLGCCKGNVCASGRDDQACGGGGGACVACAPGATCGGQGTPGSCGCKPTCTTCGGDDGCGGKCQSGSCPTTMHCAAAACACDDARLTACAGTCVDTTKSHDACGSCTKACSAAATCASSKCVARYGRPEITTGTVVTHTGYFLAQAIAVTSALTLTRLGFNETSGTPSGVLGLYSDASGAPKSLLAQTAIFPVTVGANEIPVTAPVTLAPGTYWLVMSFSADAYIGLQSGGAYEYATFAFGGALPNPCPAGTNSSSYTFGIWLSGTE